MCGMASAESTQASVHDQDPVRPTKEDEVAASGSELIGGPLGRRALLGTSWWTPVRIVALVAIGRSEERRVGKESGTRGEPGTCRTMRVREMAAGVTLASGRV